MYQRIVKPLLFLMPAEAAHHCATVALKFWDAAPVGKKCVESFCNVDAAVLRSQYWGLRFSNPIGLAAGFDKNCDLTAVLPAFGFGFVECGTVTALAQPGNPKPRLFRLAQQQALINRLGFNNCGADQAWQHLSKRRGRINLPLGINIGKSKVVDLDQAAQDYLKSFTTLWSLADYFTINVSSPNTPGLRLLQNNLEPLLQALQNKNADLALAKGATKKPILVKLAPDLHAADLEQIVQVALQTKIDGLIISNTTIDHTQLHLPQPIQGGLSGRPLMQKSTEMLRLAYRLSQKKLMLIGVGGVFSAQDAYEKILAGANLVQVYTGWIYNGPLFVKNLNQGLAQLLVKDGFSSIDQAIGSKNG